MNSTGFSRRHFLASQALSMGPVALAWLLNHESASAAPKKPDTHAISFNVKPKAPPREPQAKAMISLQMQGGPSHLDLCDRKMELEKQHLKPFAGEIKYDNAAEASAKLFACPWKWSRHGDCGMELTELVPGMGSIADEITLIRSMHTGVNNHGQSIFAMNSGRPFGGRPTLGSWLTYGLGSPNENLPAYLVLTDPGGLPVEGIYNWSNGWLPSLYQGTVIRPKEPRILNLNPPPTITSDAQNRWLSLLDGLNREHLAEHPGEQDLSARIASFELAAKMQTAAKEALDLSDETKATQDAYGLNNPTTKEYGSRCLIARRLVERGVRFVQICTGNQNWDHHGGIIKSLPAMCLKTDGPIAALVKDLKQRGLLDSTLVHWGGEMGRLPVIQNEKNIGRDHNTFGFSTWLAGGGVKGGCIHGETDEFGHKAVKDVVNHYDFHATVLHLFGLDHASFSFARPNGEGTLTDGQTARIVNEILNHPAS